MPRTMERSPASASACGNYSICTTSLPIQPPTGCKLFHRQLHVRHHSLARGAVLQQLQELVLLHESGHAALAGWIEQYESRPDREVRSDWSDGTTMSPIERTLR